MWFLQCQYVLINGFYHHEVRTPDGSHVFSTVDRLLDADSERIHSWNSNMLLYDVR